MVKILQWIALHGVSILGMAQVIVKFAKEALTLVINILFPIIPDGKFETIVLKSRSLVEILDKWIEKGKTALLKVK